MSIPPRFAVWECLLLMLLLLQQPAGAQEFRSRVPVHARLHTLETQGAESQAIQAEMVTQLEKMHVKIRTLQEQAERQERRLAILSSSLAERRVSPQSLSGVWKLSRGELFQITQSPASDQIAMVAIASSKIRRTTASLARVAENTYSGSIEGIFADDPTSTSYSAPITLEFAEGNLIITTDYIHLQNGKEVKREPIRALLTRY